MDLFSPSHLLLVLLIVVLVFGTKKLRNIGSDLGGAVKGFKEGMREDTASAEAAKREQLEVHDASNTVDVQAKEKSSTAD